MVRKCIVGSCIVIKGNKTLVLMHKRLGIWLYPGGHVDEGETPVESAIRETREETGFRVKIISKKRLKLKNKREASELANPIAVLYENVPYKEGRHMHFDLIYLGKPFGKREKLAQGESKAMKWVSKGQLDSLNTYENVREALRYAFTAAKQSE
ncbi:MAG: NUDIX domain-containing protein [Candidatus Micrarchaeota archaeon]|nr:NUDIX domain-containing protein [Candidatus Micrarchaeota archaeon]MDE1834341.1 NUDIX domain-containing protein [Candidatus Micrarchaeota archaeon]MDE1859850.1 NUDIX domain-containing protein [Candidatus Micrarchaeota archaeon]